MIVMKFGGSSLESAEAVQRVISIVRSHLDQHPVVVVSAMGKTTDGLLAIARLQAAGKTADAAAGLVALQHFHIKEAGKLLGPRQSEYVEVAIRSHFEELEDDLVRITKCGALTPELSDSILALGERLSSMIVTAALRRAGVDATHLDSRAVILTDSNFTSAAPRFIETNALLRRKISKESVTVMGGFIGSTEDRRTTTLGRGGSDYTAAIAGAAIGADDIQIWTDVDGMLTCDPRIVEGGHCLRSISYAEAAEMAEAGAKVLHPATVVPAVKQRIPVTIRNSRNPQAPGTRISDDHLTDGAVMSIACRRDLALLHLAPRNTRVTPEFGQQIWDAFRREAITPHSLITSAAEFTVAVEKDKVTPKLLETLAGVGHVSVDNDRALISLIGRNAAKSPRNLARVRNTLKVDATMTAGSASRLEFLIAEKELPTAVRALHQEFFATPEPRLFIADRSSASVSIGDNQRDFRLTHNGFRHTGTAALSSRTA